MEAEWLKLAQQGKTIDIEMKAIYGDPNNVHRPSIIVVEYSVDGVKQEGKNFQNARP